MILYILKYQAKKGGEAMATMFIKNFPDDLHRQAKAEAALQGVTLREIVAEALTAYLKVQEKKRAKRKGG
jgi:plasmid stability protein